MTVDPGTAMCFRSILTYFFDMQSAPHAVFAGIELQHVA